MVNFEEDIKRRYEIELKSLEFLETLSTNRLLTYYRKEREKFYSVGFFCSCCDTPLWELYSEYSYKEEEYKKWQERLEVIKAILNKREHVGRKVLKNKK